MSLELKIKSKHLAVESTIIRREENKIKKSIKWLEEHNTAAHDQRSLWHSINNHRKAAVRPESRSTYLARAYIKGQKYSDVENKRKQEKEYEFQSLVLPRTLGMIKKYGSYNVTLKALHDWLQE